MKTDRVLILEAASFAAARHHNQRRKNVETSPYINQPMALADRGQPSFNGIAG